MPRTFCLEDWKLNGLSARLSWVHWFLHLQELSSDLIRCSISLSLAGEFWGASLTTVTTVTYCDHCDHGRIALLTTCSQRHVLSTPGILPSAAPLTSSLHVCSSHLHVALRQRGRVQHMWTCRECCAVRTKGRWNVHPSQKGQNNQKDSERLEENRGLLWLKGRCSEERWGFRFLRRQMPPILVTLGCKQLWATFSTLQYDILIHFAIHKDGLWKIASCRIPDVQESFPTLSISEKAGWTRMPTGAALSVLPGCEFGKDRAGLRDWDDGLSGWMMSVDVDNKRHRWCLVVFRSRSTMGEWNETTSQAIALSKKGHILSIMSPNIWV